MFFAILSFLACFTNQSNKKLLIDISNIKPNQGKVMLAVYDRQNFMKKRLLEKVIESNEVLSKVELNLNSGEYAIAIYQDLNTNQKLDTNIFGVPQEPYGFSNNTRPKFRAPNFEEAKINLTGNSTFIKIKLENW